jgi:hypothetical protein
MGITFGTIVIALASLSAVAVSTQIAAYILSKNK